MSSFRGLLFGFAAIFAIAALTGAAVQAADNSQKIGVVDVQKVYKDAPRVKQFMEQLDVLRQTLGQKLDARGQNLLLDENEVKELVDLAIKANATDKEKARVDELKNTERTRDAELKSLQEAKDLNDQQKARLKELQDLQKKSKDTGSALAKDYEDQFQGKVKEMDDKARVEIQGAVSKVAESKGFTLVLDKTAALVGGIDITDDVIAKLDRKAQ